MRNNDNHVQFFLTTEESAKLKKAANEKKTTKNVLVKHWVKKILETLKDEKA